ncbi:MAG: hypothetical protein ACRDH8_11915 [Actinomycetota bacterium]
MAALAMGALAITPAGSAVDRLSKKEKKQGDTRWINVGEKATTAGTADTPRTPRTWAECPKAST